MPVAPYVVPARPETSYPEVRVSAIQITQRGVGSPLVISYQIDRYRVADGVPEDAPAGSQLSGNVQKGLATVLADPELAAAIQTVTAFCVGEAVAAGLLTASE